MSLLNERLNAISHHFGRAVSIALPIVDESNFIKVNLRLADGTSLRVSERWKAGILARYSYYWLDGRNNLIIGWDNAPHHPTLLTFPDHKHVGTQTNVQPSDETTLEDVLTLITGQIIL